MYETHNLSFLRIFQQVIRDTILERRDNGGDITHERYMLQYVDEEINNIDEEINNIDEEINNIE